jgi:hypothetical protein
MYTKGRKTAFRTTKKRRRRQKGGLSGTKQEHLVSLGASSAITLFDFLFGFGSLDKEKEKVKDKENGQPMESNKTENISGISPQKDNKTQQNTEEQIQSAKNEAEQKAVSEKENQLNAMKQSGRPNNRQLPNLANKM